MRYLSLLPANCFRSIIQGMILFFALLTSTLYSQNRDSLWVTFKNSEKTDSARFNAIGSLARLIYPESVDSARKLLEKQHEFAVRKGNKNMRAQSSRKLGLVHYATGNYFKALPFFQLASTLYEELGDNESYSACLTNIGNCYFRLSDYTKALDYQLKALKICESYNDTSCIIQEFNNLGSIYCETGDYPQGIKYFLKSYELAKKAGNGYEIVLSLTNTGLAYHYLKNYDKSIEYHIKSLQISKQDKDKEHMAISMENIADNYIELRMADEAFDQYNKALKLREEMGDSSGIASTNLALGEAYIKYGKPALAEKHLLKAAGIAKNIQTLDIESAAKKALSEVYEKTGKPALAVKYFKEHIAIRDNIINEEKTRDITRKEMQYEFDRQTIADSIKNANAAKIKDAQIMAQESKLQQEKTQRYFLYGFLALIIVFALMMFNRFKITQRQKQIIEKQKQLVDNKNKAITESINYARQIQSALSVAEEIMIKHLPGSFIYQKPKDIVSGDFYWFMRKGPMAIFAVADCTGHGVPGAFLTMLGNTILNNIINEKNITDPGKILNHLHESIQQTFKSKRDRSSSTDGMDITLCTYHYNTGLLQYSGAKNHLYHVHNNDLSILKVDPWTIGSDFEGINYTTRELQAGSNDSIYLFTDGILDQFGGPKNEKFGKKRIKELLLAIDTLDIKERKETFVDAINNWKGETRQIDDQLVLGLKLSLI